MSTELKNTIDLALRFHQNGELEKAETIYKEILTKHPESAQTLNYLGLLKIQTNKTDEAVCYLEKAVKISPCAYFFDSLGRAYAETGNKEKAIENYKKAIELEPLEFDSWFNLSFEYKKNKQIDEAIGAYKKAIEINPQNHKTYFNLANIYENLNDTYASLEHYKKAYELSEGKDNDTSYFLGLTYLKTKDFKNGLIHHENRPSKQFAILCQELQYKKAMQDAKLWNGEDIKDKTLYVYYESGLGDTLMYLRYLDLLKDKCAKLLFNPQICFIDLLKINSFGAEIIDYKVRPEDLSFDYHIPIMSIPYVLQLNTEDIPLSEGYLKANPQKVQNYKEKYFNNDKFKIGVKWAGNTVYDLDRVINIEAFNKIFDLPNTQFYSVQKGEGEEEFEKIPKEYKVIDLGTTFNDFDDTTAALENMDLIICNDTSIAHLAGAMGKPCWILLPYVQNWRWHTDISYSPWYKSIKMFKQNTPGDWDEVFGRVKTELITLLKF